MGEALNKQPTTYNLQSENILAKTIFTKEASLTFSAFFLLSEHIMTNRVHLVYL